MLKLLMADLGSQRSQVSASLDRKHISLSSDWFIDDIDDLDIIEDVMRESMALQSKIDVNDSDKRQISILKMNVVTVTTMQSNVSEEGGRGEKETRGGRPIVIIGQPAKVDGMSQYTSGKHDKSVDGINRIDDDEVEGEYDMEDGEEEEEDLTQSQVFTSQSGIHSKKSENTQGKKMTETSNLSSYNRSSRQSEKPVSEIKPGNIQNKSERLPSNNHTPKQSNTSNSNLLSASLNNGVSIRSSVSSTTKNKLLRPKGLAPAGQKPPATSGLPQIRDRSVSKDTSRPKDPSEVSNREDTDRREMIIKQQRTREAEIDSMLQLKFVPGKTRIPFSISARPKLPEYTMPNKKLQAQKEQVFKYLGYDVGQELEKASYQWDEEGNMKTDVPYY